MTVAPVTFGPVGGWPRLTVDQYHRMLEDRVLAEGAPIELLDGFLVLKDRSAAGEDPMSVGKGHRWVVQQLTRDVIGVRRLGCDLQTQQPVVLPPDGEPEPDGAIIVAATDDYRGRKPVAEDVFCVIEVADSSLEHDRTTKHRMYAVAGIPQYVIVNLVDRVVEVYESPHGLTGRYTKLTTLGAGQTIAFNCGNGRLATVAVDLLLP